MEISPFCSIHPRRIEGVMVARLGYFQLRYIQYFLYCLRLFLVIHACIVSFFSSNGCLWRHYIYLLLIQDNYYEDSELTHDSTVFLVGLVFALGGVTQTRQHSQKLCQRFIEPRWQTSMSSAMKIRYYLIYSNRDYFITLNLCLEE